MPDRSRDSRSEPTGLHWRYISVSVGPGATAFTVMPVVASSFAQTRVQASNAAFAAAYGVRSEAPSVVKLVTLMMRPHWAARIPGRTACKTCTAARTLRS
jgi:hypothetical protein